MRVLRFGILAGLALVLLLAACTRSVLIGSDFLDDEQSLIQFRDDLELTFHTQRTDSILVHSDNVSLQLSTYMVGRINDPIFGRYEAEIFAQPVLPTVGTQLIGSTLDSVVVSLRYDTTGLYGDYGNEPVTISVYQMAENPPFEGEVYSNRRFMVDPDPLGSVTFTPRPQDSVLVHVPDTVKLVPQIRIPLSLLKVRDILLQDSVVFENQDSFLNYFNGLQIVMTSGSNTILGIDLLDPASGMTFYYDKDVLMDETFQFVFTSGSVKTLYLEHDFTGAPVESALTPDPEVDHWYVQGMAGPTTTLTVGGLESLGTIAINQAQLEFYATFPDGDMGNLYPPCPYLATQINADTALVLTNDVTAALSVATGSYTSETFKRLFGGSAGEPDAGPPVVFKYTMIVTDYIQDQYKAVQAGEAQKVLYLNPIVKGIFPHRAVVFGPGHPDFAPKLRVHYTDL
jgi:hypothetical protein